MTNTSRAKHPSHEAAAQRAPGSQDASEIELHDADLDRVTGGDTATPPRDAASGLPTGRRQYLP